MKETCVPAYVDISTDMHIHNVTYFVVVFMSSLCISSVVSCHLLDVEEAGASRLTTGSVYTHAGAQPGLRQDVAPLDRKWHLNMKLLKRLRVLCGRQVATCK